MRVAVVCGVIAAACVGTALAMEPMMMGPTECAPLRTATELLMLDQQQQEQVIGLQRQYEEDFRTELEKLRVKLDEDYTAKTSDILNDEQKNQLKMLLAAEQTYKDVISVANQEYREQLISLFTLGNEETDEGGPAVAGRRPGPDPERLLRILPEDKKTLLQRFATFDPALREKHTPIRTKYATASAQVHRQAGKVDWANREAREKWFKEKEQRLKEIDEQYMKEALDLLDEKQAEIFAKAVEAMKKWQEARDKAKDTYMKTAEAVVGPEKARQLERYFRGLSYRARF